MENYFEKIVSFLDDELAVDSSGHSLDHALRVYQLAKHLQGTEGGNATIIKIAALVHDVIDPKLFNDVKTQKIKLYALLETIGCTEDELEKIFYIIENISYKGGGGEAVDTIEAQIVQDADRLDAIGAIGIGRTFMYGGARGSKMYDDNILPMEFESEKQYREHKGTVLNHFDEKLFKLKDLMNTKTGREIAHERHNFMVAFVKQFKSEWHLNK
ncbi:MAG TPA: phosphohydrolase [Firmicutes bacterium]|nr:phosphohydrolase [Bacillota bacterium]